MVLLNAAPAQQQNQWSSIIMLLMIVVVFYFFMIRPQQKKQKEQKLFRDSLKKGDKIITAGGIYGKVAEVGNYYVVIETEGNVRLKVDKSAIHKDPSEISTDNK